MYRLSFLFLVFFVQGHTQELYRLGAPFIKHYNTHEMGFDKQTWDITQNEDGVLYFANSKNILEYDGERWQQIHVADFKVNRSLSVSGKDSLYIGMDGDYGLLSKSNTGGFDFKSLFSFNPDEIANTEEFWKLHEYKGYQIFQTFRNLYVYDGTLTTKIPAPYRFKWSNKVGEDFYVNDVKYGLFKFSGTNLMPIVSDPLLNDKIIGTTRIGDRLVVITNDMGLYFVKDNQLVKWNLPNSALLEKAQIFSFLKLKNGDLALGTVSNGLYIIDQQGNFKVHLNKRSGLQNNTILTVFEDSENNLWLGLDFGLDYVKINSNLTYKFDYLGDFGSTYAAKIFKDSFFIGTNQGLYTIENLKKNDLLAPIRFKSWLSGQVWILEHMDELLWVGHDTGAFTFDGEKLQQIGSEPGAWNFTRVNEQFMVSGNYNGISIYKKIDGKWKFHKKLQEFTDSGRFVEIDNEQNLWISVNAEGVHKLAIDYEQGTIVKAKYFDIKEFGMEELFVTKIDNEIIVVGQGKVLAYNSSSDSFNTSTKIKDVPAFTNTIKKLPNQTWFLSNMNASVNSYDKCEPLEDIEGRLIYDVMQVFPLNETQTLVPIYNGFAIYTGSMPGSNIPLHKVKIRTLGSIDETRKYARNDTISYAHNDIMITYAQPTYRHKASYQTRLNDGGWSDWKTSPRSTLLNLKEGDYTFTVRAKAENKITEDRVEFLIEPPIYRTKLAYVVYFLFFSGIAMLLGLWNRYRLKKQEQKLLARKRISLKEQEQRFQLEQQEQQKRIVELENAQLQEEVQNKSRELTQVAHVNMNKNKILKKIKEKLTEVQDKAAEKLSYPAYNELKRYIEYYITDKENELFTINFDKSHQDFYSNLSEKYPALTPKDLRLCAYLRINLSSKEIAPLLGISSQSVDVSRHRLRKKMDLDSKDNLTTILASFG